MINTSECSICFEDFREDQDHLPKNMKCGDTFCEKCIKTFIVDNKIICPNCGTIIMKNIEEMPINKYALNSQKSILCYSCSNDFSYNLDSEKTPRILNCGHTICTQCLYKLRTNDKIECIFCLKQSFEEIEKLTINKCIIEECKKKLLFNFKYMKSEEINLNQLDYKFSLGLLGDTESGKTSIFHYITYEEPLWEPPFRTGPDRNKIFISIKNKAIKIILYDTPRQERYRSISIGSLREVQALLLVFSLSKIQYFSQREDMLNPYKKNLLQKKYTSKAFNIVKLYLDEILSLNQQEKKLIYLIGNKCDDIENRLIKTEDAKSFAKENNLKYYEISAKTGKNIKNILGNIILDLMEKYPNQLMNKNDKIKVNKNNKKKTFNFFLKQIQIKTQS